MLFLPAHVLMHEASFLLFVPTHLLVTRSILAATNWRGSRRRFFTMAVLYGPAALALVAVILFGRPDEHVSRAICARWMERGGLENISTTQGTVDALPGSFKALSWSFWQGSSLTLSMSAKSVAAWLMAFGLFGVSISVVNRCVTRRLLFFEGVGDLPAKRLATRLLSKYYLLPLLFSLPLYVMGSDLGRWFAVSCINYSMITLSAELLGIERSPDADRRVPGSVSRQSIKKTSRFGTILKWVVVLFLVFFARLPHAVNRGFNMLPSSIGTRLESFLDKHR